MQHVLAMFGGMILNSGYCSLEQVCYLTGDPPDAAEARGGPADSNPGRSITERFMAEMREQGNLTIRLLSTIIRDKVPF